MRTCAGSITKILLAGVLLCILAVRPARAEELSLEQRALSANVALQSFLGEKWITLPDLALLLKGSFNEDPVSHRSELTFRDHKLVFLPESRRAAYDGQIKEMKQPARLIAGVMAIPLNFASLVANPALIPAPQPRQSIPVFQPVPAPAPEQPQGARPAISAATVSAPSLSAAPTVADIITASPAVDKNKEFTIVVDAGHGYQDSGAVGPWGLKEKDVNLDLALRVVDYLKKNRPRVKVVMTRKDDTFLKLEERTQLANGLNADMFVSIHTNSSRTNRESASGVETYYPARKSALLASTGNSGDEIASLLQGSGGQGVIQRSQYLAASIQAELADIFKSDMVPDRGIRGRSFFVLKYTNMVSVLVEVGFICNQNIEANLRLPEVRQAIATAIGRGVEDYLDGRPLRGGIAVDTGAIEEQSNE